MSDAKTTESTVKRYSADDFQAMGDAGYSDEERLTEVHKFYAGQFSAATHEAWRIGRIKGCERKQLIENAGICVVIGLVIGVIGMGAFLALRYDRNQLGAYLASCKSGDTLACMAAVQDQWRLASQNMGDGGEIFRDRIVLYKEAYRLKTGRDL
jgi:hypothetical protein